MKIITRHTIKSLFLLVLSMFVSIGGFGQIEFREIDNADEWSEAIEDARSSEKLLFLDIYATWCGPCKYLDNNVYTDEELGEYYNDNYINLKMDGETSFGAEIAGKYSLRAYPTMYYLNPDEDLISKIEGVREAEPLISIGRLIKENAERLTYYEANYESGDLNPMELKNYQRLLAKTDQTELANEVANRIIPSLSEDDILNPDYKNIIINSSADIDSKVYRVVSNNEEELSETWNPQEIDQLYAGVFNATLYKAISNKDRELLQRIIDEFLPVYMGENSEELSEGIFVTKKLYYANTSNWEKYSELVMSEFESKYRGDDTFLYRQAYEVANEYNQSTEALRLALNWMLKAKEINPSFDNLVLTAFIHGMLGEFEKATELVEKIQSTEKTEKQQKVLDDLVNLINKAKSN